MSQYVYSVELFDGASGGAKDGTVGAGETIESAVIDVNSMRPLGQFASQLVVTGSGTVDVQLWTSINGTDFVLYDTLFEDQGATAGTIENHAFAVCTKFKVKVVETGGENGAVVSHWLGVQ